MVGIDEGLFGLHLGGEGGLGGGDEGIDGYEKRFSKVHPG